MIDGQLFSIGNVVQKKALPGSPLRNGEIRDVIPAGVRYDKRHGNYAPTSDEVRYIIMSGRRIYCAKQSTLTLLHEHPKNNMRGFIVLSDM